MKKVLLLLFILSMIVSCKGKYTLDTDARYYEEFYNVLNDLIRISLTDVSVIMCETKPVYKTMWGNIPRPINDSIEPPPPGFISYDTNLFNYYVRWNRLDSADAAYMFQSIDSTKTFKIDPDRVLLPVLSKNKFAKIFQEKDIHEGYKRIRSEYGTSCFVIVSTPIFSKNYTKVLISIDYQCGPTWGQGYQFLMEKRNGLWWLVDYHGTWES